METGAMGFSRMHRDAEEGIRSAEGAPQQIVGSLLFELRGETPGSVRPLAGDLFRIGSARDNDLVVNDRTVSAYQVEIALSESGFFVRNVDASGTAYLNGEHLKEAVLQKGDVLTLGETVFRYVAPGESISQTELWSPVGGRQTAFEKRRSPAWRMSFLTILIAASLTLVLMMLLSREGRMGTGDSQEPGSTASKAEAVDPKVLRPLYDQGMDLLAARRWDEAIVVFSSLRKQAPSFLDTENAYQEAVRESRNLDLLNQGKGLLMEDELLEAKKALQAIEKGSVYFREMERLVRGIDDSNLDIRIVGAEEAIARGDWATAKKEAESILSKYPNHKKALRILNDAKTQRKGTGEKPPEAAAPGLVPRPVLSSSSGKTERLSGTNNPTARPAVKTAGTPIAVPSVSPSGTRREGPLQKALDAYLKGDLTGSASALTDRSRTPLDDEQTAPARQAARMLENIRSAESTFQQARMLQDEGRVGDALSAWEKFLEKDLEITGGGQGLYFERASSSVGRIYYERGKKEFDRGDVLGAFLFWYMAGSVAPDDKEVQSGLARLDELAKKLYREGYSLQEINLAEAIRRWKEVLTIVPPEHPYYQKARKGLERFSEIP